MSHIPKKPVLYVLFFLFFSASVSAQEKEVIKEKGYTLTFINQDQSFDQGLKKRMVETFFKVYPLLCKTYNKAAVKEVTFVIDTAYKGVAATDNGRVSYSPVWFKQHPEDIDVVTHEVMHIVQAYGGNSGPWWITEGIADYVRFTFGVDNTGAKWALPGYKTGQTYDQGYRVTAGFFVWLDKRGKGGSIKLLDSAMRNHAYNDDFWKAQTGKSLQELWAEYSAQPKS